ncbi:MAG TPA: phage baseplate assembly protein V [Thermoanaerobaculia bacterium]|nr:phage baseplate assembly protein V [Thermoanaerobaculia bacterium]
MMDTLSLFESLLTSRDASGLGGRWYGVYTGIVSDINDPESFGRVKVTLPWAPDTGGDKYDAWARLATFMGGDNRGSWFIPDVDDEVLVAFEGGDPRRPYVVGALWNGKDKPPESMDGGGKNFKKVLRSRNGVKITLDDKDGQEQFIAETPGGQKITLKDGPGVIELADSNGNSIKMEASGITITTSASMTINASTMTVNASSVTVSGPTTLSATLTVGASITTPSITSASYTPGAGNMW